MIDTRIDRVCHKCQTKGHIARMCTTDSGHRGIKRRLQTEQMSNESRRIAMVNERDEHTDVKEEMVFADNDENV